MQGAPPSNEDEPPPPPPTPEELELEREMEYCVGPEEAFTREEDQFGTYSVDLATQTVTHTVEGAMVPDWVGMKLVRRYHFLAPDRVELGVVPDAQLPSTGLVLVWQRVH